MGGNALKNTPTRRLQLDEFRQVSDRVSRVLREALPGMRVAAVPAYRTKTDFGDLDLMVTLEPLEAVSEHLREKHRFTESGQVVADPTQAAWHGWLELLVRDRLGATETAPNGNVVSFDVRLAGEPFGFQVDVIAMREATYAYALDYYSFNDLGNLIGRTADKMGLEHGHRGLRYAYMEGPTQQVAMLTLTTDYDEALGFLGYNAARFRRGFDTLEDIFLYVAGSAYFNPDIFLLENRNAKARQRDRKRATYQKFLDWCAANELPRYVYPESKEAWLPHITAWFPRFGEELAEAKRAFQARRAAKARFNGEQVAQWTGLQGMALNRLMERVKLDAGGADALREVVLSSSQEQLRERVLQALAGMPAQA